MWTFFENGRFSRRIWPDWGNTAWADMAGLGSIGLNNVMWNIKYTQHKQSKDIKEPEMNK